MYTHCALTEHVVHIQYTYIVHTRCTYCIKHILHTHCTQYTYCKCTHTLYILHTLIVHTLYTHIVNTLYTHIVHTCCTHTLSTPTWKLCRGVQKVECISSFISIQRDVRVMSAPDVLMVRATFLCLNVVSGAQSGLREDNRLAMGS